MVCAHTCHREDIVVCPVLRDMTALARYGNTLQGPLHSDTPVCIYRAGLLL